jgi:hypothetical protein
LLMCVTALFTWRHKDGGRGVGGQVVGGGGGVWLLAPPTGWGDGWGVAEGEKGLDGER